MISLTNKQSDKINILADAVKDLVDKGIPVQAVEFTQNTSTSIEHKKIKLPIWAIIACSTTCLVVTGTCIVFILKAFNVL